METRDLRILIDVSPETAADRVQRRISRALSVHVGKACSHARRDAVRAGIVAELSDVVDEAETAGDVEEVS